MQCIYIYIYIYIYNFNNYLKQQLFAIDTGCYICLNILIYNLRSCYETSRKNKKEENLDIIKVHFTASKGQS